jgi:hypothetical protein
LFCTRVVLEVYHKKKGEKEVAQQAIEFLIAKVQQEQEGVNAGSVRDNGKHYAAFLTPPKYLYQDKQEQQQEAPRRKVPKEKDAAASPAADQL